MGGRGRGKCPTSGRLNNGMEHFVGWLIVFLLVFLLRRGPVAEDRQEEEKHLGTQEEAAAVHVVLEPLPQLLPVFLHRSRHFAIFLYI